MATVALKKKKKKWISIVASKEFNNREIGETLVAEGDNVANKNIYINLTELIGDIKKQNIHLLFTTKELKENKITTELKGFEIAPSYIRRLIRGSKERVEDSFIVKTKDNVNARVKTLALLKFKTKKSILTDIYKKPRTFLMEYAKETTFSDMVDQLLQFIVQKEIQRGLKKIYPAMFLIKYFVKEK